jgi:lipopolysaccharide export system permease protein
MLDRVKGEIRELQIERKGNGPDYPTYVITAREASWQPRSGWALQTGAMHVVPDSTRDVAFSFDRMIDRKLTERPVDLMAKPRSPQEMRYTELTRFIVALERSGGDANVLRVERALKIAIPMTCLIIALFGAPLATSTQRGGAAFGVGISLATTIVFLMMIQLTKAVGGKGIINPDVAAWIPNMVFAVVGLFLLARVRT